MKKLKRLVSVAVALAMLLLSCMGVFAASITTEAPVAAETAITEGVIDFLRDDGYERTLNRVKPLWNADRSVAAYYITLNPEGYAIVDTLGGIVEYAAEGDLELPEEPVYYFGAGAYFIKSGASFRHVFTGYIQSVQEAAAATQKFVGRCAAVQAETEQLASTQSARVMVTQAFLPGNTRRYNNTDGTCGSTAAVILLMYYRDHIDSFMVPSWHDTADGQTLKILLYSEIENYNPGCSHDSLIDGLNYYYRWRGISDEYSAAPVSLTWVNLLHYIHTTQRPVLLGIASISHMTVGTGLKITDGVQYACVNQGWGRTTDACYRWSEFDWMAALNK